ncbi:NAD-binding Rossmann fold oxidoreductase [Desarmillaria tabescens]|uniref:NAD-binding Rossmann fold oxidoreductase n=1 Tax=Armillaria tabescens TaxID=1929756 RepID=A0AA39MQF6_ARMTA|nr:NAD-binding Rossmann fold oxidoreductase [Desarmillaria tabescens]KAK0442010.1 NAD-binding Rossmann fold oxidoreductase [Desarmillaria tabescens]
MTEPIRVGVIGLSTKGWASTNLVPPLLAPPLSSHYKLLAVSTSDPTSAEASAAKYSTAETAVKGYHTPESIAADPNLDLIAVSVKTPNHVENATKAIEAGKDLFIEWPAGRELRETKLLADLAKEKGIRTIVGLQARQSPLFRKVKKLVEEGEIGDVLSTSVTSRVSGPHVPWGPTVFKGSEYCLKKENGATLLDIAGGHFLEAFTYILGPIDTVFATVVVQHPSSQVLNFDGTPTGDVVSIDGPSQVAVSGTLKSGAVISLHWRTGMEKPANEKAATPLVWVIDGTKGSIRIESDNPFAAFVAVYEPTQLWVNDDEVKIEDDGRTNAGRTWEEYLKGEGAGDYPDLQHAVQIKSIVDAIWRSAEGGVMVTL